MGAPYNYFVFINVSIMRLGHVKHYTSLLRDFMEDFALSLATVTSKKTLWPAFISSGTQDLMKQTGVRSVSEQQEGNILSLKLPLYEHWKHSVATQYLRYTFK